MIQSPLLHFHPLLDDNVGTDNDSWGSMKTETSGPLTK